MLDLNRRSTKSQVQDIVKLRVKLKVNHFLNMDTSAWQTRWSRDIAHIHNSVECRLEDHRLRLCDPQHHSTEPFKPILQSH